jgi:hypothetical protein
MDLLTPTGCVLIPKYQRRYTWDIERAHSLIRDVAEVATLATRRDHWIGVVIFRHETGENRCAIGRTNINHTCREIVDGQQRLTTIRLWTKALIDHSAACNSPLEYELTPFFPQSPNDLQFECIENGVDVSRRDDPISLVYTYFRYVLWLGEEALLSPEALKTPDRRMKGAPLDGWWDRWIEKSAATAAETGVVKSSAVDTEALLQITVQHLTLLGVILGVEEPERVFSALNGSRTELSQFDHLRNFCFGKIVRNRRDDVFEKHWETAEQEFESLEISAGVNRDKLKENFLYDYLISMGEGAVGKFNASRSFGTFQRFQRSQRFTPFVSIDNWVSTRLHLEVLLWKAQRERFELTDLVGAERLQLSRSARRSLHRIRLVSDGPPAPFVLWTLRRLVLQPDDPRHMDSAGVEMILRRLEGYLFKTRLSGDSLTNMRAAVITSMPRVDAQCISGPNQTAVEATLREVDDWTTARWSTLRFDLENAHRRDGEKSVYDRLGGAASLALLDAISEQASSGRDAGFLANHWEHDEEPFWVEHIYPQKPKKAWKALLSDWGTNEDAMSKRLHDLGNLTALPASINQDLRNGTLSEKQAHVSKLPEAATSILQDDWLQSDRWDPIAVDDRTHSMIEQLMARWPDPIL